MIRSSVFVGETMQERKMGGLCTGGRSRSCASSSSQVLLLFFSSLRRFAIPGWVRCITWLAYLGGDAVATRIKAWWRRQQRQHAGGDVGACPLAPPWRTGQHHRLRAVEPTRGHCGVSGRRGHQTATKGCCWQASCCSPPGFSNAS
jgi:hypothetical protein